MQERIFYTTCSIPSITYAVKALARRGCTLASAPGKHVTHLLTGVPAANPDGTPRGGGTWDDALSGLPGSITIVGGHLDIPQLDAYPKLDLLKDPLYLAENADITAHCALKLVMQQLPITLKGCQVLVLGWGRIGKCLGRLLRKMGAVVTVAARKEADLAILRALGYETADITKLSYELLRFRVIFNTVPQPILTKQQLQYASDDCLKIDLASVKGMDGPDVHWERGLPNRETPETSGELIAKTILRLCI